MISSPVREVRLRLAAAPLAALVLSSCASGTAGAVLNVPKDAVLVASTGSWTAYHRDDARTGYDPTVTGASGATTGWTSPTLDGAVYAEPLVLNGFVLAATLSGTVYALNQTDGTVAWSRNVGVPRSISGTGQCGNVDPLGILGTPVIDQTANRIYVSEILNADNLWHVFGVDLTSHNVVLNTAIPASIGTGFDWTIEQQRGALGLANGYVYVPFGGRAGDCGPYHGWVVGVPTSGSTSLAVYETPSTAEGIWAPGGVVVDDTTGNVFFATGNAIPCSGSVDSDSVIRTGPTLGAATSFFQPADWSAHWCGPDLDLGSVSPILISPSLAFTSGKFGQGFLLDPTNLGGTNGQLFPAKSPYVGADVCRGDHSSATFGSFAYAAPYLYVECEGSGMAAIHVDTVAKTFTPCDAACGSPNWFTPVATTLGPPIVAGGVVWAVSTSGGGLYGWNATSGVQVFHSAAFPSRRFSTPSEAGGTVYVGANTAIKSFDMTLASCASVSVSVSPASPQPSGSPVAITANATGCTHPNPLCQFWIQPPGGSWTIAQPYSSNAMFNWNTTGLAPGVYKYSVWARDSLSTAPYDTYIPGTAYTLTTLACTGITASAAPASPQDAGTTVTVTASASGCPNPRFEFWTMAPGGSWTIAQAYSSSASFAWNTNPPAGAWKYSVWVRDSSSTAAYDTFFPGVTYTLTTTPCPGITASASPGSPQDAGTAVTVTASASGCPNARFEFWTMSPGGSWTIAQAWSATSTFTWNTTPPAGIYKYSVWVRDRSSGAAYDTYFPGTAYTLTTTPCTAVTASAAPPSPQPAGTAITITASSTGCPNPRFEFWLMAPGGSWTIVQTWASANTFTWSTTGLTPGNYKYSVWARDASSAASYDTYFPGTGYTLT